MKNYDMIHLIQDAGLPKDAERVVTRAFNRMYDTQDPNGCLLISVSLCIALEHLGYSPKLCVGKCWAEGHDFYHAWTELDGKVIDVAIYGNSHFLPIWPYKGINPQVNKGYADTDVKYEPFVFDEDFKDALIAEMMGKSFYSYSDNAPIRNMVWNLIMYYLDSSSSSVLSDVKEIARKHTIGEGGGPDA